jgi:NTP pyrophosphatase (non-canonical NTP hydrolase)
MTSAASADQVAGQHYKNMPIQPAEFCQKNNLNFCESAVIKYVCRHESKNGSEDILKAIHFLHLLLEWEYRESVPSALMLELDMYQRAAAETAIYPTLGHQIVYPALGLAGEAGEVAEKVKKMCRDDSCILTEDRRQAIKKELGDVLWYVSETARCAGLDLSDVAWTNIKKLELKQKQGQLQGSGDDRGLNP